MSILSTNQKLIKVDKDYSAGENIGIYEHTISSRNWSPDITYAAESAFQRATGYTDTQISALSGEVSSEVSQLGSDIQYISGVALTSHQSLEGYLTKASGDEYYQPIGSYATVSQLESTSGEIVNLIPTDYVSNETLEQTSGNIVNLIPDTSEFITNASAELTYQPIGNYLSSNALEGYATQDWVQDQGYITGVDLSNYYTKNETSGADELAEAFSQIGPGGDQEVNSLVHSNSGEWNNVSAKLDSTAFSTVSGDFLTSIPDEYATKDFVSNSITGKLDISSFSSVSGDFLTNEDLNGYATESFVQDTSANITALIPTDYYPDTNPSGFISGVDLSPYQTIEGMTAYQPVGSYATTNELEQVSADITATIPSTAGLASESYVQTNSAVLTGMIDGKQDTLTFGYDEQDRINSINSSALAGGGDVPEDVMVESAIEYNAVNEISGYNGSAIAQYGAEKQFLVHDDTLVHASNSAQYALGCNISALQRLMGIDETVLYSNTAVSNTIVLNEACTNFERLRLKIYSPQSTGIVSYHEIEPKTNELWFARQCIIPRASSKLQIVCGYFTANNAKNYTFVSGCRWYGNNNVAGGDTTTNLQGSDLKNAGYITEIVGIGRKE